MPAERKPHPCPECKGPITKRPGETRSRWNSRTYCSRACSHRRQKRRMGGWVSQAQKGKRSC